MISIQNFLRPYYSARSNIIKNLNSRFKIIIERTHYHNNNHHPRILHKLSSRKFSTFRSYNDNEGGVGENENVSANVKGKESEGELEEIDRSQYPELFPSEEELSQYYDEEREHNDADDTWFVDPAYENPQEERIRNSAITSEGNAPTNDDFIPLWQRKAANISESNQFSRLSSSFNKDNKFAHPSKNFLSIVRYLEEDGIENITLIDVRQKCDFADWIIIGEGKSTRQLGGAVDGLYKMVMITFIFIHSFSYPFVFIIILNFASLSFSPFLNS